MNLADLYLPNHWHAPAPVPGDVNLEGNPATYHPDSLPGQILPKCHNTDTMMLMVERHMRSDMAMVAWSSVAKRCVDFVEGRQWTAEEIAKAELEDRPHIVLNKVGALLRLVLGFHRNNRIDNRYLPTDDSASDEAVAMILTKIAKQISANCNEPYVDTEVFMDGMATGRGFYDYRLSFSRNDFGEIFCRAKDPFTIRPDPDGDSYNPNELDNEWNFIMEDRWVSIDEIEFTYGKQSSWLLYPLLGSSTYRGGMPADVMDMLSERAPWRTFGGRQGDAVNFESYISNAIDTYRKNIRIVECQHRVRVMQRNIIDMETGDRTPVPTHMPDEQLSRVVQWAAHQYTARGAPNPIRLEWRPTKRVRWTTMVGDIVIYDDWSPYRSFTICPFFPYFRRGMTRGMVDDLIDPQREINLRRSSEIDIVTRSAHSGWMWHQNALEDDEKEKIENFGAAPGINIEWKGDPSGKPEQIRSQVAPTAMARLEEKSVGDLKEISNINDSALGQLDRVQSGRAIEARQRQSVLGIESYMDNMRRTKKLGGEKKLELIQDKYTEPRIFRVIGDGGTWEKIGINIAEATGRIVNDVTIGRYDTSVDETPLSSTFLNAQFEEVMEMVEKGLLPIPMVQDVVIDLSNIPQKELLKKRVSAYMKAQGLLTADDLVASLANNQIVLPTQIPAPQPHGVPGKQLPPPGQPGGPPQELPSAPQRGSSVHGVPKTSAPSSGQAALAAPPTQNPGGL